MDKKEIGKIGEDIATKYLEKKGYTTIERNFKCLNGEIDIIMALDNTLHFIEVKTRRNLKYGLPSQSVNSKKLQHIKKSAEYFFMINKEYRTFDVEIDIVEILIIDGKILINHMKNVVLEGRL